MNRIDFQALSEIRIRESAVLLAAGFPAGAYYLAGYAVECALKACISKRTRAEDFPPRPDLGLAFNWDIDRATAESLLEAVTGEGKGLLPWLKVRW